MLCKFGLITIVRIKMKYIFLVFTLALFWGCINNQPNNMSNHPLNNKNFNIIDYPTGLWEAGWLYHTEVMEYLFKSEEEKMLAEQILLNAGYGAGETNYIYINGNHIAVNGEIFYNLNEAKDYIHRKQLKKVLYTDESAFPKKIPDKIKTQGIDFWVLDWRKCYWPCRCSALFLVYEFLDWGSRWFSSGIHPGDCLAA
jgi:hypothetical protein